MTVRVYHNGINVLTYSSDNMNILDVDKLCNIFKDSPYTKVKWYTRTDNKSNGGKDTWH